MRIKSGYQVIHSVMYFHYDESYYVNWGGGRCAYNIKYFVLL